MFDNEQTFGKPQVNQRFQYWIITNFTGHKNNTEVNQTHDSTSLHIWFSVDKHLQLYFVVK